MHKGICVTSKIGWWLVVIGGLNWGLVGLGSFFEVNLNVVNLIFGSVSWLESLIYFVVGLATVMALFGCRCKTCGGANKMPQA